MTQAVVLAQQGSTGFVTGFKNKLINGNFDFWQRGTTATYTTSSNTVADRWQYLTDGTLNTGTVISRQTFTTGQTEVPNNPTYFLNWQYTNVNTPSNYIRQRVEDVRTCSGQTITISGWIKCATGTVNMGFSYQQEFGTGGSPSAGVYPTPSSFTVTTSWQFFQSTFNVLSIAGKTIGTDNNSAINIALIAPATGSNTISVAQMQCEVGNSFTTFDVRPLQTELALCQRYFQTFTKPVLRGVAASTTAINRMGMPILVTMRSAPTLTMSGTIDWYDGSGTGTFTAIVVQYSTVSSIEIDATAATGTSAALRPIICYVGPNTGTITASAEL